MNHLFEVRIYEKDNVVSCIQESIKEKKRSKNDGFFLSEVINCDRNSFPKIKKRTSESFD